MGNMPQDEVKFRITSEPEPGLTVQHTESLDHQSGQKPELVSERRAEFYNTLNCGKFSGHFLSQ